ncbi:hypothetical protein EK0264_12730 [Epidermidibacterium keratini]|uniref:Uncharacterized protein n=1 Tax=Epidermidibacterium keratini TaxID=1891644 RepID=A0A7L4YQK7_9ACTN|nr:hypothetical protein [Epidermidibacterium keratini]QHC01069.1 hypothetical protein EK0264_12730 [Epidermidibacterium keratini]
MYALAVLLLLGIGAMFGRVGQQNESKASAATLSSYETALSEAEKKADYWKEQYESSPTAETTAAPAPTTTAEPTTTEAPPPPTTEAPTPSFGAGTYLVNVDIPPGTYQSSGGSTCYWERLSGTSGEFDDIIANDLPAGQAIVTIEPTDVAFSSTGCGTWTLVP